jgi:hypothetical protein
MTLSSATRLTKGCYFLTNAYRVEYQDAQSLGLHRGLASPLLGMFEVGLLRPGPMGSSPAGSGDDARRRDPALD